MSLSTSNSRPFQIFSIKGRRAITGPLLVCLFFLVFYLTVVGGGVVTPSDGINQRQVNVIKAERYVYNQSEPNVVLVGSSLTAEISEQYFNSDRFTNIALAGGCSQTSLDLVQFKPEKPNILLVEMNDTIIQKIDSQLTDSIRNPGLNLLKTYVPIFREEYQPISVFVHYLKTLSQGKKEEEGEAEANRIPNREFRETLISRLLEGHKRNLSEEIKETIIEQAQFIQDQLTAIERENVRVVLFDIPGEQRLADTVRRTQVTNLLRSLFPPDTYEWLPEPPSTDWTTYDGIHLIGSDAKKYALFIKEQLLNPVGQQS